MRLDEQVIRHDAMFWWRQFSDLEKLKFFNKYIVGGIFAKVTEEDVTNIYREVAKCNNNSSFSSDDPIEEYDPFVISAKQLLNIPDEHLDCEDWDKIFFAAKCIKWQKEQLQPTLNSHTELLKALKLIYKSCSPKDVTENKTFIGVNLGKTYVGSCGIPTDEAIHKAKQAIEKAELIIK